MLNSSFFKPGTDGLSAAPQAGAHRGGVEPHLVRDLGGALAQVIGPVKDLAVLLADMAASTKYGVYHATNEGYCSWAELAAETFRQAGKATVVEPVPSSAYPTKAVRPKNSRMSKACLDAAGFHRLPAWQDAVDRYLQELAGTK